jgi:hypothetical protein
VNIVGIMFACAQGTASGTFGTEDAFRSTVASLVSDFNLRAANSQAGVQLRLMRDDFVEEVVASDGSQSNLLHPFQDRYRADLGAIVTSGSGLSGTIPHAPADLNLAHSTFKWGLNAGARDFSYVIGRMFGGCSDASQTCDTSFPAPRGYVGHCTEFLAPFCNEYYYDTMATLDNQSCVGADYAIPYFSNPGITYTSSSACSTNVVMGDSQSNVAALMTANRSTISQYQIAAPIWFANATRGSNPADGSNFNPSSSIKYAVDHISGGVSCAVIYADGEWNDTDGIFNETTANGGPVLLSTPCVIRSNKNTPVHVR